MKKILSAIKEFFKKIGLSIKYMFVDRPEEVEELVSFSGSQRIANLNQEEVSNYSNILHKNDAKAMEKIQNSLCYIVVGAIFFVLGFIFIFLCFKKRSNRIIGFNFVSLQFVICVVCFAIAAILLILGLYKAITAYNRRKQYNHYIMLLSRRDMELKKLKK